MTVNYTKCELDYAHQRRLDTQCVMTNAGFSCPDCERLLAMTLEEYANYANVKIYYERWLCQDS